MGLFLASWSTGFFALLFAYMYIRLNALEWPPAGRAPPPRIIAGLSTLFTIASSIAYQYGLYSLIKGKLTRFKQGLFAAILLTFVFMVMQLAAAMQAVARNLAWDSGVYASFFWLTAGFHYAHVIVGFIAGVWLIQKAYANTYTSENYLVIELWSYYWHSIGVLWILMYVFVFLI